MRVRKLIMNKQVWTRASLVVLVASGLTACGGAEPAAKPQQGAATPSAASASAARSALTVRVVSPQTTAMPVALSATGTVAPWQEAVVGAEALSEEDHLYLRFTEQFEGKFLKQGEFCCGQRCR